MTATEFAAHNMFEQIMMYLDTDHAECVLTHSTTRVPAMGRHCVRHASNVQSTIALSGESEWYGLVVRQCSVLCDWGYSSGTGGVGQRSKRLDIQAGPGRARRIQTRFLRVQERVREGHLRVPVRARKFADLFTKVNGVLRGFEHVVASMKHKKVLGC